MVVLCGTAAVVWWWTHDVRLDLSLLNEVASVVGYRNVKVPHIGFEAPTCAPGAQPAFGPDLAPLKRQLGDTMGQAVECEHLNTDNGDMLQQTTTGLAVYQASSHRSTFTDGWRHWALTSSGMVTWVGVDSNPPLEASQPTHDTTRQG
jgi:hypothetical protein